MVNSTPGVPAACPNCGGQYRASRYHVAICVGAAALRGHEYDIGDHVRHLADGTAFGNAFGATCVRIARADAVRDVESRRQGHLAPGQLIIVVELRRCIDTVDARYRPVPEVRLRGVLEDSVEAAVVEPDPEPD